MTPLAPRFAIVSSTPPCPVCGRSTGPEQYWCRRRSSVTCSITRSATKVQPSCTIIHVAVHMLDSSSPPFSPGRRPAGRESFAEGGVTASAAVSVAVLQVCFALLLRSAYGASLSAHVMTDAAVPPEPLLASPSLNGQMSTPKWERPRQLPSHCPERQAGVLRTQRPPLAGSTSRGSCSQGARPSYRSPHQPPASKP